MKRLGSFLAFAAVIALVLLFWRTQRRAPAESPAGQSSATQSKFGTPNAPIAAPPIDATDLAAALNSSAADIRADLRLVSTILDTYRTNFLREGNPTGTNAEITAALAGENVHRLILIPRNHPAINAGGELCDRWGTPFFFHAQSGTQMEIRSAGPDKTLFTADDAVLSP